VLTLECRSALNGWRTDHLAIRKIPCAKLWERIERSGLPPKIKAAAFTWIKASFRKRYTQLGRVEQAGEKLPGYLPPNSRCLTWGIVLAIVLPEVYAESPQSLKTTPAQPGTFERIRRYKLRHKKGLAVLHPKDGIHVSTQETIEPQPEASAEGGEDLDAPQDYAD